MEIFPPICPQKTRWCHLPHPHSPSGWELFCRLTTWSPASLLGLPPQFHMEALGSPEMLAPCCRRDMFCTGIGSNSDHRLWKPRKKKQTVGHYIWCPNNTIHMCLLSQIQESLCGNWYKPLAHFSSIIEVMWWDGSVKIRGGSIIIRTLNNMLYTLGTAVWISSMSILRRPLRRKVRQQLRTSNFYTFKEISVTKTGLQRLTLDSSLARCWWILNLRVWYSPKPPPSRKAHPRNVPLPLRTLENNLVCTAVRLVPYALPNPLVLMFPTGYEKKTGRRATGDSNILQPTLHSVPAKAAAMLALHKFPECITRVAWKGLIWPALDLTGFVLLR